MQRVLDNLNQVLIDKGSVVELLCVALLCQGHVLLEDVPGLGKTMLVKGLARSLGGKFSRIQFTPDLLPSDVIGVTIYNQKTMEFLYRPGPVMANIVLADEINRTSPKTQSSLLEAMEERQLTVDGETWSLPSPFMVVATQNPIEYEGTFPLPEAQLDRFLLRLEIGYPEEHTEMTIVRSQEDGSHPLTGIGQVMDTDELMTAQKLAGSIKLSDGLLHYIVELCSATRKHPALYLGVSPRGSLALARSAKALAWLRGRDYVLPDDIKEMAIPTLSHRLILNPEDKLQGLRQQDIVDELVNSISVPTE
ncbi:MAG: MoxR family ATPase [Firmicutes bacterium]|nr:MoxR family ATPase [Bacillota bacterium]